MNQPVNSRRKRILYIDQTASLSGGELALLSLIQELNKEEFEPVVILFESGPLVAKLRGLAEVHVMPLDSSVQTIRKDVVGGSSSLGLAKLAIVVRYIARLVKVIRQLQPDIVHTNSLKADLIGGIAARLSRVPLIWHIRDRIADDYLPHRAVVVFRKTARLLPHYVLANSEATLQTLFLPINKPRRVITSGFDVERFASAGRQRGSLANMIQSGELIRVGIVGRISPWKGQDVFLHAATLILKSFPGAHFFIIGAALFGEQEHEAKLHSFVQELNLQDAVTFCGFQENVAQAIGDLDILVHASVIPEPLGQVIAQGMAAGKPVVAARGGGASEIVNDGVTGWLVPPGSPEALADAVIRLLENPHEAEQVALHGQAYARTRFDEGNIARQVEQVYTSFH